MTNHDPNNDKHDNRSFTHRWRVPLALTWPVWVVLYLVYELATAVVSWAEYLVVRRTLNELFGRSVHVSGSKAVVLSPLLLAGVVPAIVVQLLVALVRLVWWFFRLIGRWQVGAGAAWMLFVCGLVWLAGAVVVFVGSFYHPLPWELIGRQLGEFHWYFTPRELMPNDTVRRDLLRGAVFAGVLLLVVAPVVHVWLRWLWVRAGLFVIRLAGAVGVLYWLLHSDTSQVDDQVVSVCLWALAGGVFLAATYGVWRALQYGPALRQFVVFMAVRLLERKRIALFSLAAVTLCTAMLLIIVSVMGGFLEQVRAKTHGVNGDLLMDLENFGGFAFYEQFIEALQEEPYASVIAQATPVVHTYGIMRLPVANEPEWFITKPVMLTGIRPRELAEATNFADSLYYENKDAESDAVDFSDELPDENAQRWGVLGLDLVAERMPDGEYYRYYPRGQEFTVTVAPLDPKGRLWDPSNPAMTLQYFMVDDYRSGVYDIDAEATFVPFEQLQQALKMDDLREIGGPPPRCSRLIIKLAEGVPLESYIERGGTTVVGGVDYVRQAWQATLRQIGARLQKELDRTKDYTAEMESYDQALGVQVRTWEQQHSQFIGAVENEKRLMILLFSIVSLVAVFLVLCIFYMIVLEKTRDIGILKSIGASSVGVGAIFLMYGAAIGLVGSLVGTLLGSWFVYKINDFQDWLVNVFGWRVWDRTVYAFDEIPSRVDMSDAVTIIIAAIVACMVGAVLPAWIAGRRNPVEALRYE